MGLRLRIRALLDVHNQIHVSYLPWDTSKFPTLDRRMTVASCQAQKCPGYARADGAAGYTRRLGIFNCILFGRSNLSMHQNTHSTTTRSGGDAAWRLQYQFQRISGRRYPIPCLLVLQRRKKHLAVRTSARCPQCARGRPSHTFKKVQDFSIALKSGRSFLMRVQVRNWPRVSALVR